MKKITDSTMNLILIILFVLVLIFTGIMIWLYLLTGGVPDTLVTSFFVAITGECGFMGWIKTSKSKDKERQQKLEDKERQKTDDLKLITNQEEAMKNDKVTGKAEVDRLAQGTSRLS